MRQALRTKRNLPEADLTNTYDLVDSIISLPSTAPSKPTDDDDIDDELEHFIRKLTLLLIRLQWGQAASQMDSIDQEFELLYKAPEEDKRFGSALPEDEDQTWRLDFVSRPLDPKGPLLDASGRVRTDMQPCIIMLKRSSAATSAIHHLALFSSL